MAANNNDKKNLQKFYKPYLSDDESDTDSDTYTSSSSYTSSSNSYNSDLVNANTFVNLPIDKGYSLSGSDLNMSLKQPEIGQETISIFNQPKSLFTTAEKKTTVMIHSSDRDAVVFPYPTSFSIRLPRVYKNVSAISVSQIKMLSSFYYFSDIKGNNFIKIQENGRSPKEIYIRNGTYTADDLVKELTIQLNETPLYTDISLNVFISKFSVTGDYSLIFNEPGDKTYNNITDNYESLTSKQEIVAKYFSNNTFDGVYYTYNKGLVAYYYPMLKDLTILQVTSRNNYIRDTGLNNQRCSEFIYNNKKIYDNIDFAEKDPNNVKILNGGFFFDRIVYGFLGLDDEYVLNVVKNPKNQAILDKYKDDNTWKNFLINKYICVYDSQIGRMSIQTPSLNTSIVKDFDTKYSSSLKEELTKKNVPYFDVVENGVIVEKGYEKILADSVDLNGVYIDMYNHIQTTFRDFFGVDYGLFPPSFYAEITQNTNNLRIYDSLGRYGWDLIYSGEKASKFETSYNDLPHYWPGMISMSTPTISENDQDYYVNSEIEPGKKIRYTFTMPLETENGYLKLTGSKDTSFGYQDINNIKIRPTTYFKTSFKSKCRQLVYIAIMPATDDNPSEEYYLDNENTPLLYDFNKQLLIDNVNRGFNFFDVSQNMMDGPGYMRSHYGENRGRYLDFIARTFPVGKTLVNIDDLIINTSKRTLYFRFLHGGYNITKDTYDVVSKFKSDIYIETEDGSPFGSTLDVYWYRDRSAFMADNLSLNNGAAANPKHYFLNVKIPPEESTYTIANLDFISFEYSFLIIKALSSTNTIRSIKLRVFSILHDDYGIYKLTNQNDFRRIPVDSTSLLNKNNNLIITRDYYKLFDSTKFRNAYDLAGVSNNLLNYIIFDNIDSSHYDPYHSSDNVDSLQNVVLRYSFKYNSPATLPTSGTDSWSQFFYSDSNNVIMDLSENDIYYDSTKAMVEMSGNILPYNNEYVFTNWYKAGANDNLFTYKNINVAIKPSDFPEKTILPFPNQNIPFSTFAYRQSIYGASPFAICYNASRILTTDISFNQIILNEDTLTNIIGVPFLPPSGNYISPTKIVIKFSYIQPSKNDDGIRRRSDRLYLNTVENYSYNTFSTQTGNTTDKINLNELNNWDDKFLKNRRNLVIGVFLTKDVYKNGTGKTILTEEELTNGINPNIDISKAICTLSLKKIVQVGEYYTRTNNDSNIRNRTPEWGTYYVYEKTTAEKCNWVPMKQTINGSSCQTVWGVVKQPADIDNDIYTGFPNIPEDMDIMDYYKDVSGNSLCFIPFYPIFNEEEEKNGYSEGEGSPILNDKPYQMWKPSYITYTDQISFDPNGNKTITKFSSLNDESGHWKVGSFNGLTYTNRPYIPFSNCGDLEHNANIYFKTNNNLESICIEDLNGSGLAAGLLSTYLGTCGPFYIAENKKNNVLLSSPDIPTFFNVRVNINISNRDYNPISELKNSTNLSKSFADTMLFAYDATTASSEKPTPDKLDILRGWGLESKSNYIAYDDDGGLNNLSCLKAFPVEKDQIIALNLRSYLPTTSLNCGLRIMGKNRCDFGITSIANLIKEVSDLVLNVSLNIDGTLNDPTNFINKNYYTHNYAKTLIKFNDKFKGEFVLGLGFKNPTYSGMTITSQGFKDFMTQYNILFRGNPKLDSIKIAQSLSLQKTLSYIKDNYTGILPESVIGRTGYTDPLSFSLLFKSAIPPKMANSYDRWGLGWNLGFEKIDTQYSTRFTASTFIRIVEEFIYMKLNDELNVNCIDSCQKENLSKSRDQNGITGGYFGKLLLNAFGSYSQTFVQSAKVMPTIIPKVDHIRFSFIDTRDNKLFNLDAEFNVSLEITEIVDTYDIKSGLSSGSIGVPPKQNADLGPKSVINEPNRERPKSVESVTGAMNPKLFEVKDMISITGAVRDSDFESKEVATVTGKNL
jgi:hypothetical protein